VTRRRRITSRAAKSAGLAAILLGLAASPAVAAPTFEINVTRDEEVVSRSDERVDYSVSVANTAPVAAGNETSGMVTVELELPAGQLTYAYKAEGAGWSCEELPAGAQPAKAICTRSDSLAPNASSNASYPAIVVVTALGADAPDLAVARATVGGGAAESASDVDQFVFVHRPFGLESLDTAVINEAGEDYRQAGGHPYIGRGDFVFATKRALNPSINARRPVEHVKQVFTDLPRGLAGNALAVPELCPAGIDLKSCPPGSVIGGIETPIDIGTGLSAIWAVEPEFGTPAQFVFQDFVSNRYTLSARLRPEDNYAVSLDLAPAPVIELRGSTVTICGYGGRATESNFAGCKQAGDSDVNPKPLFTNPTRCEGEPTTRVRLNSWENPAHFVEKSASDPENTGCEAVPFEPSMALEPSSRQADSPTGLNVSLTMPTHGLETKDAISQANLKRARITFPEGMAVNASAGHHLGACSAEQVKLKTNLAHECPDSSKVGTVEIDTPLIEETLSGAAYIAKQGDVEAALIGLYFVFESKKDGIIVKLPAKVELNPKTGQLVTIVDESPEAPFSAVRMHFPGGPEATLLTPPKCGTYEIKAELSSWAAGDPDNPAPEEIVTDVSTFEVTEGPNGGPCPSGALEPKLDAGTSNPVAGQHSPFVMRLHRDDGSQRFSSLSLAPPPGLVADLRGIPYCPDAVLASISGEPETGQAQIDNPSCPAASLIGRASAGAGAGPRPFYVHTGKAYLAGPYKGAPLSLALVTPAVAGPLDLGNVVVRTALHVNPKTARITAVSDPIPTILHGILLDVRDIRVAIDRARFTLNPTNCEPMSVDATVQGDTGGSANVSSRFQIDGCRKLGFKPRISLQLKGGTKRGDNPALRAVVRPRPGDANIGRAAVTLPRSAFLDQAHIRTVCTRVQFAADNCPKGAIYGRAEAVTPLLDQPLRGAVYLRSSDNKLPDLVADLRGPAHQPIKVEAAFRTDSIRGGIRSTLDLAPDAPVTKFTLQMQGGKKGLVINSRDICATTNRANARLVGQNGRRFNSRPKVRALNCNKQQRKRAGKNRRP
jgi:hypothetical protein